MAIVRYMGTKAALVDQIEGAIGELPQGPLLDAFSGMSAVGRLAASSRNVWTNDVQAFSETVSRFHFQSGEVPSLSPSELRQVIRCYGDHIYQLREEYRDQLLLERQCLLSNDWKKLVELEAALRGRLPSCSAQAQREWQTAIRPFRFFCSVYAGTYFGIRQCIEIDALRKAVEDTYPKEEVVHSRRSHFLTAMGVALSKCSNSTGHFAQYLSINEGNYKRALAQRRRSITHEWIRAVKAIQPIGSVEWRTGNRTYRQDACTLLGLISQQEIRPAVIYADPPYTADQYSRYYHLLDTLVLYDYPIVLSKGRYRQDRFVSGWSLASKVEECFIQLVERSNSLGSSLVISYPANGLLHDSEEFLPSLMASRSYKVRRIAISDFQHSTMGASKGRQRLPVTEQIFIGVLT